MISIYIYFFYTHTYVHTYIHTYVRTYVCTYILTYVCVYVRMYVMQCNVMLCYAMLCYVMYVCVCVLYIYVYTLQCTQIISVWLRMYVVLLYVFDLFTCIQKRFCFGEFLWLPQKYHVSFLTDCPVFFKIHLQLPHDNLGFSRPLFLTTDERL